MLIHVNIKTKEIQGYTEYCDGEIYVDDCILIEVDRIPSNWYYYMYIDGKFIFSEKMKKEQELAEIKQKEKENGELLINKILQDNILQDATDYEAYGMKYLYPEWNKNHVKYAKGERVIYNNNLYRVLVDHISKDSTVPDVNNELFVRISITNRD